MIDSSIIGGLIPGMIALFIALIGYCGQRKTQKEVVELGHKLTQERFLTEKCWNERRCLYAEISRTAQDLYRSMCEISEKLERERLQCLTCYYIYDKYLADKQSVQWDDVLLNIATEDEKKKIEDINVKDNIQDLWNKLFDMRGDVTIFATEDIRNSWKDLFECFSIFQEYSEIKLSLLLKSERNCSNAETKVGGILDGRIPKRLGNSNRIDLFREADRFNTIIREMHSQMRKDLGVK